MSNTPTPIQFVAADESAQQARQSVAQSTALAVQDAVANLRNLNSISATAIGVSLAQYIQTGDYKFVCAINQAHKVANNAAENFGAIGTQAGLVLREFPADDTTG